MANEWNVVARNGSLLKLTHKELLPPFTQIFRVGDGVTFYFKTISPMRLYVDLGNIQVDAKLPSNTICHTTAHGNSIYFSSRKKNIFKTTFNRATSKIDVDFVRDNVEFKSLTSVCCSRIRAGNTYMFRMWDDPDATEILLDAPAYEMEDLDVIGIHSDKIICVSKVPGIRIPAVRKLTDTVIVVEVDDSPVTFVQECAQFVYFVCFDTIVYTLYPNTLQFLKPLQLEGGFKLRGIAGINDGVITVVGTFDDEWHSACAQLPNRYYIKPKFLVEEHPNEMMDRGVLIERLNQMQLDIDRLDKALTESTRREESELLRNKNLVEENKEMKNRMDQIEEILREAKIGALKSAKKTLKFDELEKLSKLLVCIQLENGTLLYFDNVKNNYELFAMIDSARISADLGNLEGESDCAFKGTIGNQAFFRSARGKFVKFFRATLGDGAIIFEQINEIKTSEISLFDNQPMYFIELSREWSVYHYHENHNTMDGEKFDISEINHLSKYSRHYHKGILYLFREQAKPAVEKINNKVVRVEGPLIDPDVTSFYAPANSDFFYILNAEQSVLLILNTANLSVSQVSYEPPSDANHQSIVGIHDGVLTMAFEGVCGRRLFTTTLP